MTLKVYVDTNKKYNDPIIIMDEREPNASGSFKGNDVWVEDTYGNFNIHITNEVGGVSITHNTARNIISAVIDSLDGEFYVLEYLEAKQKYSKEGLVYKNRWSKLTELKNQHLKTAKKEKEEWFDDVDTDMDAASD